MPRRLLSLFALALVALLVSSVSVYAHGAAVYTARWASGFAPAHPIPAPRTGARPAARLLASVKIVESGAASSRRSTVSERRSRVARERTGQIRLAKQEPRRSRQARFQAASFASRSRSGARRRAVAQPQQVVSVIRPTTEKPQLESVAKAATDPIILPTLYNNRGRLIMPSPLFGSRQILLHQNEIANQGRSAPGRGRRRSGRHAAEKDVDRDSHQRWHARG